MSDLKNELIEKIENRNAVVGIIGLGYVGLPLAVAFADAGFRILGIDVDTQKVEGLNDGISHVEDVESSKVSQMVNDGLFEATADYSRLQEVDTISICVPTPLRKTKDPDVSYIVNATEQIAKAGVIGKAIILESTTYPGTTEEILQPRLSQRDLEVGSDFFLAFSPERIDPGRTDYVMWNTPKVLGGVTEDCLEVSSKLYGAIVEQVVPVSSPAAAEMVKLLENTFRAVNIGLVNEMALMCDKLGLNVWEIVDAAATKPYGFMKFTPGPGLGGHCIPVDPHYLNWKLKTLNYTARFIELADEVNRSMPEYVVEKVTAALNGVKKAVNGSRILVIGVAYKPNVSDVRESPALDIIYLLQQKGAEVSYHDPYVDEVKTGDVMLKSVELNPEILRSYDLTLIVTNHKETQLGLIKDHSNQILDTRNALDILSPEKAYQIM